MVAVQGLSSVPRAPYRALVPARIAGVIAFVWPTLVPVLLAILGAFRAGGRWEWGLGFAGAWAALNYGIARFAFEARSTRALVARLSGVTLGVLGGFVLCMGMALQSSSWPLVLGLLWPAFVAAYSVPLALYAGSALCSEDYEGGDRTLRAGALWAALPYGLLACMRFGARAFDASSAVTLLLGVLVPLGAALAASVRIHRRRQWVRAAARGERPPWRIVSGGPDDESRLPRLLDRPGQERTLTFVVPATDAFRRHEQRVAVAIVRGD
jgi:hypothetical protein